MQFILTLSINKYPFLMVLWNVFLALIPCLIVFYMLKSVGNRNWKKLGREKTAFVLLFFIWLFFLPNTIYLFTMIRHVAGYCENLDYYRVCAEGSAVPLFFFFYALMGVPTFYYALSRMTQLIKTVFSKKTAQIFPVPIILLTSIGVLFGLYERFNSWDIIRHPFRLVRTAIGYFQDKILFFDFIFFALSGFFIYYGLEWILKNKQK